MRGDKNGTCIPYAAPVPDFVASILASAFPLWAITEAGHPLEQKLVLPAIKWPECHIDAVCPVITDVRSNIYFLYWLPADSHSLAGFQFMPRVTANSPQGLIKGMLPA